MIASAVFTRLLLIAPELAKVLVVSAFISLTFAAETLTLEELMGAAAVLFLCLRFTMSVPNT